MEKRTKRRKSKNLRKQWIKIKKEQIIIINKVICYDG
jgi:hypothetical protein